MSEQAEKHHRIADIKPGDKVEGIYLLAESQQRTKKNGEPYFFLKLGDASGQVQGVMWDNHSDLISGAIVTDDFIFLEAHAADFNGAVQLTARRMVRVDDDKVDTSDFLAVSPRPRDEMEKELDELIGTVENNDCKRLLDRLFNHDRFRELYCMAPAAAHIHQAYIHGLLEHTLNVVRNALNLAEQYKPYSRDLLVTAGLLHDIGKIREYSWSRSIGYTDEGRLVGHISIGANMVDSAIRSLQREDDGFDTNLHHHILHLILSHHGKLEYGSPVLPKTKEALILHYADYSDAYLTSYMNVTSEVPENSGTNWTAFQRMFESPVYAGPAVTPSESPADLPTADLSSE